MEARKEFETDIKALDTIEEKFGSMNHFPQFVTFLQSGDLSPNELENLYDAMSSARKLRHISADMLSLDVEKNGFPLNRETYVPFADKFGIQTSTKLSENSDALATGLYLKSLPALQSIKGILEVTTFV